MRMFNVKVIVFDLDGVLLESAAIKTDAFREMFSEFPEHLEKIVDYHKKNGGISRYKKFDYIYSNILKRPYDKKTEKKLNKKFQELVLEKIIECPFVRGTIECLDKCYKKFRLYVVSGTPDSELKEILKKRGLMQYFIDIFGSSKEKSEWLNVIIKKEKIQSDELLFIGDSPSDYHAAAAAGANFIARIREDEENFFPDDSSLVRVADLTELPRLLKMKSELCRRK